MKKEKHPRWMFFKGLVDGQNGFSWMDQIWFFFGLRTWCFGFSGYCNSWFFSDTRPGGFS
jgi:hypothetical protein